MAEALSRKLAETEGLVGLHTFLQSGGAWYTPGNEERRAVYIARHFAAWLRRTVGA